MSFYKFLQPVNSWFLYIEPTVAWDVKKKKNLCKISPHSLFSVSLSLSLSLSLVGFRGTGHRFRWLRFESVPGAWVSLDGFGGVGLWFRGWGLNWWRAAWVWWLGLKLVGLNRAAWVCGGDFGGFKSMAFSMVVGYCKRGCGGLG